MMLNKQFLALALAAGASFLVGCEDDDAAVAGKCAGEAFFEDAEVTATSDAECFDCLKGTGTTVPALGVTAESIKVYTDCDVEFQYACKGMEAPVKEKTANVAAADALIDEAATAKKFSSTDAKNTQQQETCKQCVAAHFAVSAKTGGDQFKVDDALTICGVTPTADAA